MRPAFLVAIALTALATACSPPPPPMDGGADAAPMPDMCGRLPRPPRGDDAGVCAAYPRPDGGVRRDSINVNCTSAAGNENIVDCNTRLGQAEMGARIFIGGRDECDPDDLHNYDNSRLYSPECRPLCDLSCINGTETNGRFCSFTSQYPGCPYNSIESYVVVVEVGCKRHYVGVGTQEDCARPGGGIARYALVNYDEIRMSAVACAREQPMGGYARRRYGPCDDTTTPNFTFTCDAAARPGTSACTDVTFMDRMGEYTRSVCTHTCANDSECGNRGTCWNGQCWERCGGDCGLSCLGNLSCQQPMGAPNSICLPLRQ